jgi:hypothetical protein
MQQKIAVRLYENKKFGKSFGKNLFNSAPFSASAELTNPFAKYYLDFYPFIHWEHKARTPWQMAHANELHKHGFANADNLLFSWIIYLDKAQQQRLDIDGYAVMDLDSRDLHIEIFDQPRQIHDAWDLSLAGCKASSDPKKPLFLAANYDVGLD